MPHLADEDAPVALAHLLERAVVHHHPVRRGDRLQVGGAVVKDSDLDGHAGLPSARFLCVPAGRAGRRPSVWIVATSDRAAEYLGRETRACHKPGIATIQPCDRRAELRGDRLVASIGAWPDQVKRDLREDLRDVVPPFTMDNMLVNTGGRQRSEAESRALYDAAGFTLTRIVPGAGLRDRGRPGVVAPRP